MALAGFKIVDADGHVTEPASLYSTHIDPKFRAAADACCRGSAPATLE